MPWLTVPHPFPSAPCPVYSVVMEAKKPQDALVDQLAAAIHDEQTARRATREARARQRAALRALRDAKLPSSLVAHKLARVQMRTVTLAERKRLARKLRKQLSRETAGHSFVEPPPGDAG